MKKILVVGSKGMLGSDLVTLLEKYPNHEIIGYSRKDLDITSLDAVRQCLLKVEPDIVINCAAYTDVEGAEDHKEEAYQVNAYGAEYLARVTKEIDAVLVQVSTNFVFDGHQEEPYSEDQTEYNPLNVYGESKLRGEELAQKYNDKTYIVRTSNLFGAHGKNFVQTMIRLAETRDTLQVVSDQIGNPTYTKHLAQAIFDLIDDEDVYGVYHLSNTTPAEAGISWYTFAKKIIGIRGFPTKVLPTTSETYPSKAARPRQGTILNTKRASLPAYQDALQEFLAEHL